MPTPLLVFLLATTHLMMVACGRETPTVSPDPMRAAPTAPAAPDTAQAAAPHATIMADDVDAPAPPPATPRPAEAPEPEPVVTADPEAAPSIAPATPAAPIDDGFDLRHVHTGTGPAPEGSPEMPAAGEKAEGTEQDPNGNIDPYWTREGIDEVPVFPDDDPLLGSGIPVCRAFAEGMKACRPQLDPETRALLDPLIAAILNGARALRRPHVRRRACEMGWSSLPAMLEKYCPGAFDPSIPRERTPE